MAKRKAQEDPIVIEGTTPPATPDEEIQKAPQVQNAWTNPGPSAFDFRSDTITTPTLSMLTAIQKTTLRDDVFQEDPTTNDLEAYIAKRTTHEAGLFAMSGTMGNQLAIRSHLTQIPHSVLCDYRSHILEYEAGGIASLSQALVKGVIPSNGVYLTLEDIEKSVVLDDDVHLCPTKVISLENTLGGTIMPLSEVKRISKFAKEHSIPLHLDGARIWEAVVAGAGSLSDYCQEFDSVSLCFSKGLGAPVGSMLVGKKEFIKRARWIRKAIGGGTRQLGVLTAAARVAVDETFGKGPNGEDGKLKGSHVTTRKIAQLWTALGGKLSKPVETNMVWFDLEDAGVTNDEITKIGNENGLILRSGRLVVHYQISDEAVERLEAVIKIIMEKKKTNGNKKRRISEKTYG